MEEFIVIGKIKGGCGIKGEVKVLPLTDFPRRFENLKRIFLTSDVNQIGSSYEVERVSYSNKFVKLKLASINNSVEAWQLINFLVVLPKTERMPLDTDSYYISDLVGLKAVDENGNILGILNNVIETGTVPVLVIEGEKKEILLPALGETIKKIDLQEKIIVVVPWVYADDGD